MTDQEKQDLKDRLRKKSIEDLLNLYIKLNEKNDTLREENNKLKKEKVSGQVKETNSDLRKENNKLRSILKGFSKTINEVIKD